MTSQLPSNLLTNPLRYKSFQIFKSPECKVAKLLFIFKNFYHSPPRESLPFFDLKKKRGHAPLRNLCFDWTLLTCTSITVKKIRCLLHKSKGTNGTKGKRFHINCRAYDFIYTLIRYRATSNFESLDEILESEKFK